MSRNRLVAIALVLVFALAWTMAGAAGPWEGFEGTATAWRAADRSWTDNNATGVALSTEYASEGKQSLKLSFSGPGLKACAYIDKDMDLSGAKAVTLDLYNATSGGKVAIAVCTGDSWKWQESPMVDVGPGWNKGLTFDLTSSNWKSADTGWAYVAKPVDLDKVKRFVVLFWEGQEKAGAVYIDNIVLVGLAGAGGPAGGEEGEEAEGEKPTVRFSGRITPQVKRVVTKVADWAQIDPMEGTDGWYFETWSAASGSVAASTSHVTAGATSVQLTNTGSSADNPAFTIDLGNGNPLPDTMDLSGKTAISFDVYNPTGGTITGVLVVRNGPNWDWNQIDISIPAGASQLIVPFGTTPRNDVRALTIRFWSLPAGESIYLDNMCLNSTPVPTVNTLRLDLTAKTSFGLQSNLVLDYIDDGSDAKFEVARGTLSLAGLRAFYHDRFTSSDDYMKLFWNDPDQDIETVDWYGAEFIKTFGPLRVNALYADGPKQLKGLRLTYNFGKPTVGLTGAWGDSNVVGVDLTVPLGFANLVTEAAVAEYSLENWAFGIVFKDGTLGPFGYYLEFMRSTPNFYARDSEWSKENCQKFYGKVTYTPVSGLSLTGVYDYFHKLDGTWDKRAPSLEVNLSLFSPLTFKLYYESKDEGNTTPLPHTTKFEGTASYAGEALSASLLLRQETGKDLEQEFSLSWAFAETWKLAAEAKLLTASDEYGLDLTKRFSETLDLTLSYDRKVEATQTVTTYTLALGANF